MTREDCAGSLFGQECCVNNKTANQTGKFYYECTAEIEAGMKCLDVDENVCQKCNRKHETCCTTTLVRGTQLKHHACLPATYVIDQMFDISTTSLVKCDKKPQLYL